MPTLQIISSRIGSQLTSTIANDEPEDKNDFTVFITSNDGNFTLEPSYIGLTAGYSIVSFDGDGCTYEAVIRPPATAGILTISIARNAVPEGNPAVSQTIRVSTQFPDIDAETTTQLFTLSRASGITTASTRIFIHTGSEIRAFRFDGVDANETLTSSYSTGNFSGFDYINGDFLIRQNRMRVNGNSLERVQQYAFRPSHADGYNSGGAVAFTSLGITFINQRRPAQFSGVVSGRLLVVAEHISDLSATVTYNLSEELRSNFWALAENSGFLFIASTPLSIVDLNTGGSPLFLSDLNVSLPGVRDVAFYGDTFYLLRDRSPSTPRYSVETLNIRKYRPISTNTKTTIYPVFAAAGDRIPLTQFSPDAERIIFDVGYKKPPFLSINATNELVTTSAAETCVVRLKAINRVDATETGTFHFYLVIEDETPVWRDTDFDLTMRSGSSYNLWDLVENAESLAFKSGGSRPTGSNLSDGIFTIGTVGGTVEFTARRGSRTADVTITINILQDPRDLPMDNFRYRVKIAGIDVLDDLIEYPVVSESLDAVLLNEYKVNEASVTLKNIDGKYSSDIANNFWVSHSLNTDGFKERIEIYVDHYNAGSDNWTERALFTGIILRGSDQIADAIFEITCVDESFELSNTPISGTFGNPLEKFDGLRKQSEQETYEGVYEPEASLLPMIVDSGVARSDRTDLARVGLELPSEGPVAENTGYLSASTFHTAGGFLDDPPLLRFKTAYRSEDVRSLINQLAIDKNIYNTEIDIPAVEVESPFFLNRGSIPRSVEKTRTTRLPVDWVYDRSNNRLLILLSNPERHIADLLVQYDIEQDRSRTLYTFAKGIKAHRIARRDANNYSILTSGGILQDGSAAEKPRRSDAAAFTYDSAAEGSNIRIHHFNSGNGTLTEHVAATNARKPQLGVHYSVGFENEVYIDEFEGICPEYRGAFKWVGSHLYYRHATNSEFGVARVNASGTTERLIRETNIGNWNHLNFGFDVLSDGTVYFAYGKPQLTEEIEVVNVSNSLATHPTISNNLSSVAGTVRLIVNWGTRSAAGHVIITGTNRQGQTLTERLDSGSGSPRITNRLTTHGYQTVTSVQSSVGQRYNLTITTLSADIQNLVIKRRTSAGSITTVFEDSILLNSFNDRDGTFTALGVHECLFHNNQLYMFVVIADLISGEELSLDLKRSVSLGLYRCNVTAAHPSLALIDQWDFVSRGGCNLTIHNGEVHYTEHPRALTSFQPINPGLDGYWKDDEETETDGYNDLPAPLGELKKVTAGGSVESLGNVWYEARPFNIAQTRLLSIGEDLHLCAAYGPGDEVLRYDSLASGADTAAHLVYGKTLHYVLPRFSPGGSIWAALADLAKNVNATLSFENGLIRVTDRAPYRAETDGATGTGTGNLSFSDANKAFPSSGYLWIGNEVLRFTGRSDTAFAGITRGVLETSITNHADESGILYLDDIIEEGSILGFSTRPDTNRIYNHFRASGQIAEVRDEASIATYGERSYTLDLSHLTRHEKVWIDSILQVYLENFKDLKKIVNLRIKPDFNQKLGGRIAFLYDDKLTVMQILSIEYRRTSTSIQGRTV